jgi:hypothetical protein
MSRFSVDPQIQQLRAARAGAIAFIGPAPVTVGKISVASVVPPPPNAVKNVMPSAPVFALISPAGTPSETLTLTTPGFAADLAASGLKAVNMAATGSLESLTALFSEAPTVGVNKTTTVV